MRPNYDRSLKHSGTFISRMPPNQKGLSLILCFLRFLFLFYRALQPKTGGISNGKDTGKMYVRPEATPTPGTSSGLAALAVTKKRENRRSVPLWSWGLSVQ